MKTKMTKTEYALFLLTDGNRLDRPQGVMDETGYSTDSPENALIVLEVQRVQGLFLSECRPSLQDVTHSAFSDRERALLLDYSSRVGIPDLVSRAIRKALR